jgi:hypothetical protein
MTQIHVNEQMLTSAVRYAIGRMTYVVSMTCAAVRGSWDQLSPQAQAVIARDIEHALAVAGGRGDTVSMDMDHRDWADLLTWIRERPVDDDSGPETGYPSDAELRKLATFTGSPRELMEYAQTLWRGGAGTSLKVVERWGRPHHRVSFVTGGWSGCESVIGVLNATLAVMYAREWRYGGMYVFEFPADLWESDVSWDWSARSHDDAMPPQVAEARDRLAHLEQQVEAHRAYLTSMVGVKHPDPHDDSFVDALLHLEQRLAPAPAAGAPVPFGPSWTP